MQTLASDVSTLHGIGAARAQAFAKMGIRTLRDLVYTFPRAYQNRGFVRALAAGESDLPASYVLTVAAEPRLFAVRRGMTLVRLRAFDESGSCEITFFNQPYVKDQFHTGETYRFWGKLTRDGKGLQMASPQYEPYAEGVPLPALVPVYPLTTGLTQKLFRACVREALALVRAEDDVLSPTIRRRHGFAPLSAALRAMHLPDTAEEAAGAARRFAFEEMLLFAANISLAKVKRPDKGAPRMADTDVSALEHRLPFPLTGAQKRAIADIAADLSRGDGTAPPMSRILVGDVGCGKTVCAAAAAYMAVKNGYQAALMVPTEILANQHYADLAELLAPLGVRVGLLTGSTKASEKKALLRALAAGELDLVIGTHALIEKGVVFAKLALVITDEQHRFGVMQRAALADKTAVAHMLVMSATPIPRTLSLILYGDLDISKIDEMPPGRQRVDTFVVGESYRARLNAFIRKHVEEGHQVYIVCPSVEKKEDDEEAGARTLEELLERSDERPPLKAAVDFARELSETVFPDLSVAFVHGKLKPAEKDKTMTAFARGEISILVSTTVIEVGVNVPTATLMIVENAERFGLSQLHQLRGRVGRGTAKSYCVLVSDAQGETARRRLDTMRKIYDGFRIAEEDLLLRGPGEYIANGDTIRQHGAVSFTPRAEEHGGELLEAAFAEARTIIAEDSLFLKEEHRALGALVHTAQERSANTLN